AKGFNYLENGSGKMQLSNKSLIVSTDQPKGKMVKVLFEPQTKLNDSLTYDITAWSLPYAYGLEAVASTSKLSGKPAEAPKKIPNTANPSGAGYIAKWDSMQDARLLSDLLKAGIKVRFSEVPFQNNGQKFNAGSLIITKSDNRNTTDFDQKLVEIANKDQRKLLATNTSFAQNGPDFGSAEIKLINKQNIAVLKGEDISSLNYGEVWYFFEQELQYPLTSINTSYFDEVDLSRFDVLILPEGDYSSVFGTSEMKNLKEWVKNGGKVIAIGSALNTFAGKDGFDLKQNQPEKEKDSLKTGNLVPYDQREREDLKGIITGSIVETKVDASHPMAFGYGDQYFSLKLSSDSYSLLNDGYNVAYIQQPKIVSGFVGSEAIKNLKNSMVFGEEPMGDGSFIYLGDNPLFRAFWQNGKLFFVNSVFFVNNNKIRI
ncbi:MAG: zinc carboxypeptidase, partial [Salegentibacter sp.]